jgi:integrase
MPDRVLILDAVSGLRVGERLGLKWEDVRFDQLELNVTREVVTPCKTEISCKPISMNPNCRHALKMETGSSTTSRATGFPRVRRERESDHTGLGRYSERT